MTAVLEAPGLQHDFSLLRRRRMMGLVRGVTVAGLKPNHADILTRSGIVRGDIRRSFGTASGVARGVPLTVRLRLESANSGRPLPGAAVYLWQCDRDSRYSLYADELRGENYLRGVQAADEAGWVTFTSIFPGRPHLWFEVYPGLGEATGATGKLLTAKLTLPGDACLRAYAATGYAESKSNLAWPILTSGSLSMACVTGDVGRGFTATRTVRL